MSDEELTRRQKRRHKLRAKQAAARKAEQEAEAKANEPPILQTAQDIRIWNELQSNPEWVIPEEAYTAAPKAFLTMGTNENLKPGERTQALNGLTRMVGQNQAAKKHHASFSFSVQQYAGRHSLAQSPEADDEETPEQTQLRRSPTPRK